MSVMSSSLIILSSLLSSIYQNLAEILSFPPIKERQALTPVTVILDLSVPSRIAAPSQSMYKSVPSSFQNGLFPS